VRNKGGEIFAALYELNDPELMRRPYGTGEEIHLVLANGAFKPRGQR